MKTNARRAAATGRMLVLVSSLPVTLAVLWSVAVTGHIYLLRREMTRISSSDELRIGAGQKEVREMR